MLQRQNMNGLLCLPFTISAFIIPAIAFPRLQQIKYDILSVDLILYVSFQETKVLWKMAALGKALGKKA